MGLRGIAPLEWAPVLLIMRGLFGGMCLRALGARLGGALREFRRAGAAVPRRPPAPPAAARSG